MDELPGGRNPGRLRPIHIRTSSMLSYVKRPINRQIRTSSMFSYVKQPINRIRTDENKVPIFLDRKVTYYSQDKLL